MLRGPHLVLADIGGNDGTASIQRLLERREDYRMGTVPQGALLLTAGADVQKDRIEVSVWGFGRGKESWLNTRLPIEQPPWSMT